MPVIKNQFTLRLDLTTHAKIKKIAKSENRSMTNMIETIIMQKIADFEKQNGEIKINEDDLYTE
ncbi:MAG: hypothetical protein IJ385_02495 [Ruminiclostridium sp.]|nr:hypothetical protein [Ruminiclostridium sp.]